MYRVLVNFNDGSSTYLEGFFYSFDAASDALTSYTRSMYEFVKSGRVIPLI